jgi:hypothetical protein
MGCSHLGVNENKNNQRVSSPINFLDNFEYQNNPASTYQINIFSLDQLKEELKHF